jgi:hypothetical protein
MSPNLHKSFFSPSAAAPAAEFNKCVDAEKPAGSRVLLTQHPRPSRFSGHDRRYAPKKRNKLIVYQLLREFETLKLD